MNTKIIKAISAAAFGLGMISIIPLTVTSCGNPTAEKNYEFGDYSRTENGSEVDKDATVVWSNNGDYTSNWGDLSFNLSDINFNIKSLDLSTVYYHLGITFPKSCFNDLTPPTEDVKVYFTNLPDHEEIVTPAPEGFDTEFITSNDGTGLSIHIKLSKTFSDWKGSLDLLKDHSISNQTSTVISAIDFGVKEKSSNKIHMFHKANKANSYVFNLNFWFDC